MKRIQMWCDQCGRELIDKKAETGEGIGIGYDSTDTWEIWNNNNQWIFCTLTCLVAMANTFAVAKDIKVANENI